MPLFCTINSAWAWLSGLELLYGIKIPNTFSCPSASAASSALSAESTPPERPTTIRPNPVLRTSLRINPTRICRSKTVLVGIGIMEACAAPGST